MYDIDIEFISPFSPRSKDSSSSSSDSYDRKYGYDSSSSSADKSVSYSVETVRKDAYGRRVVTDISRSVEVSRGYRRPLCKYNKPIVR